MELKASGFEVKKPSRRRIAGPPEARGGLDDRSNPRSHRVNRSARADAYSAFADEVRRDLHPSGPLESVMVEHVVSSAWRLKGAVDHQATRRVSRRDQPDRPSEGSKRASDSAADRAARSMKDALELLDHARGSRGTGEDPAREGNSPPSFECEVEPNEWPVVPFRDSDELPTDEPADDAAPIWRDRLVFDFDISDISPVVKGTWITVSHVVSLIVDGQTWADILRSHPELSEEDVRVCMAYAVAQEQDED